MRQDFSMKVYVVVMLLVGSTLWATRTIRAVSDGSNDSANETSRPHFQYEFLVLGMSCDGCAKSAEKALKTKIRNILRLEIDFGSKKGFIETASTIEESEIRNALGSLGFEAHFAGDLPGPEPLSEEEKAELDIEIISKGNEVVLEDYLAPGKFTIIDYYADWCGPCHLLSPRLERLVKESNNVALRVIDISNWESPVAKQATREFKLAGLPYVRVYGQNGRFVGEVQGNYIEKIQALIEKEEKE